MDRASNFFLMIDNFFDIMNSKFPEPPSHKPMKTAFGLEKFYKGQQSVLNSVKKEILELTVIRKKSMMPFPKSNTSIYKLPYGIT